VCNITRTLRAKQAPEHSAETWAGTSWIMKVMATGSCDYIICHNYHLFLTSLRTRQRSCCNWCATTGALRAGTGSASPS